MKNIILALGFSLLALSASAQNVGIGQVAPQAKLDINGNLIIGSSYSGNSSLTVPTDGAIIQGNVGIGTASPLFQLQVVGTTSTTNFQMTSGATNGYIMTTDGSGNATWSNPTVIIPTTTVSNTSTSNTLSTTVNGVTGGVVPIINSNILSLSGTVIKSTVNGIGSNILDLSSIDQNIYNTNGTLTGSRTVTMNGNKLFFSGGNVGIGTASAPNTLTANNGGTTAATSTSYPLAIQNSGNTDLTLGSDGSSAYIQSWNSKPLVVNSQGNGVNFSNAASTITVANLAGTGNRSVYANSSGVLNVYPKPTSNGLMIFTYTGANQYFVVPQGITSITVQLWGAGGGAGYNSSGIGSGGGGGYVAGTLTVTPGELLTLIVGGGGVGGGQAYTNAFGGGGAGSGNTGSNNGQGGSGGGRSAIDRGSTELVTAGGGGGGARENNTAFGGAGGGLTGGSNRDLGYAGGGGGTQTAGGVAGSEVGCSANTAGTAGSQFQGGNAGCCVGGGGGYRYAGAGGGGGYYGGGGGSIVSSNACNYGSSGGGGSSYVGGAGFAATANIQGQEGSVDNQIYYAGNNSGLPSGYVNVIGYGAPRSVGQGGNGLITISW